MNVLEAILGPPQKLATFSSNTGWLAETMRGGGETATGVTVTLTTARKHSAVWAATNILASSAASLPFNVKEHLPSGGSQTAEQHPLQMLIHREPNERMDAFTWIAQQLGWLVNWGNSYSEIQRTFNGDIGALWPLRSDRVGTFINEETGELFYEVKDTPASTGRKVLPKNMLDIVGPWSFDGIIGHGAISTGRESIAFGIGAERTQGRFLGKGGRPAGILMDPAAGSTGETAFKRLTESFDQEFGGDNADSKTILLENGVTWTPVNMKRTDAQFLESRIHNIQDIARRYGVPPHRLADLSQAHFTNISAEERSFVVNSLRPWLVRIERAIDRQLFKDEEKPKFFVKFNEAALMRGDPLQRAQINEIHFRNGKITLNDWKAQDDEQPYPSEIGDVPFIQANNMQTVESVVNPPEPPPPAPAPFAPPPNEEAQSAARRALAAALRHLLTKERNAAQRAAKQPDTFLPWMNEFYDKHAALMQETIGPALATCRALGLELPDFISDHIRERVESLLDASEAKPSELLAAVTRCTERWQIPTGEKKPEPLRIESNVKVDLSNLPAPVVNVAAAEIPLAPLPPPPLPPNVVVNVEPQPPPDVNITNEVNVQPSPAPDVNVTVEPKVDVNVPPVEIPPIEVPAAEVDVNISHEKCPTKAKIHHADGSVSEVRLE